MKQKVINFIPPRGLVFVFVLFSFKISSAQVISEQLNVKKNAISIITSLGLTSNLYELESDEQKANVDMSISLGYNIKKSLKLSANLRLNQEAQREKRTEFLNTSVYITKTNSYKKFTLLQSIIGVLPTNEKDRNNNSFRFRIGYSPRIYIPLSFFTKKHTLILSTSIYMNTHEFTQTNKYGYNTQYINSNSLSLYTTLSKKYELSLSAGYSNALNYVGTQSGTFSSSSAISYYFNKKLLITAGVSTRKSALEYDGSLSNFELFDNKTTIAFGTLTFIK